MSSDRARRTSSRAGPMLAAWRRCGGATTTRCDDACARCVARARGAPPRARGAGRRSRAPGALARRCGRRWRAGERRPARLRASQPCAAGAERRASSGGRAVEAVVRRARRRAATLRVAFGSRFLPVVVPPWNRIDEASWRGCPRWAIGDSPRSGPARARSPPRACCNAMRTSTRSRGATGARFVGAEALRGDAGGAPRRPARGPCRSRRADRAAHPSPRLRARGVGFRRRPLRAHEGPSGRAMAGGADAIFDARPGRYFRPISMKRRVVLVRSRPGE